MTSGDSAQHHDPLCLWWQAQCEGYYCAPGDPGAYCMHSFCQCDLIARVRVDHDGTRGGGLTGGD